MATSRTRTFSRHAADTKSTGFSRYVTLFLPLMDSQEGVKNSEGLARLKPVFLFGAHRSGTNMTVWSLDKSDEILLYNENNSLAFSHYRLRDRQVIEDLLKKRAKKFIRCALFKSIGDTTRCGEISNWFPDSKSLFIVRYPDQVVQSYIKEFGENGYSVLKQAFKNLKNYRHPIFKNPILQSSEKLKIIDAVLQFYSTGLDYFDLVYLFWLFQNSFYFVYDFENVKGVKLIIYEELLRHPERELEVLCHFMEISCHRSMIEFIDSRNLSKLNSKAKGASPLRNRCYELYESFVDICSPHR